ncbi:hypothetical protein F2P81_024957 [Scophthalmus maximus]|uniref:Uncharacterized protein n=1 Tax=Scophthalmus maximus TaxID=52904 RepID=A0A6A4RKF6_SCOMX|nr:hypothetical protein F2P81_024957 [Scophthalmus maximus]
MHERLRAFTNKPTFPTSLDSDVSELCSRCCKQGVAGSHLDTLRLRLSGSIDCYDITLTLNSNKKNLTATAAEKSTESTQRPGEFDDEDVIHHWSGSKDQTFNRVNDTVLRTFLPFYSQSELARSVKTVTLLLDLSGFIGLNSNDEKHDEIQFKDP